MSGGKIIPVIAQGDREGLAKLEAASDRLHADYVVGFKELRDRVNDLRIETHSTIADLVLHTADLRKRVERLEQKNREGRPPG
jgi:hypothetical protein